MLKALLSAACRVTYDPEPASTPEPLCSSSWRQPGWLKADVCATAQSAGVT